MLHISWLDHLHKIFYTLQGAKENSIEIAKNLLKLNIDIENVSKATGLSIKELEELQ